MVFAAPFLLVAQTRALREFVSMNRPGFLLMGLGCTVSYLSLRLLSKTYETERLRSELLDARADLDTALRTSRAVSQAIGAMPDAAAAARAFHSSVEGAITAARCAREEERRDELVIRNHCGVALLFGFWSMALPAHVPTTGTCQ